MKGMFFTLILVFLATLVVALLIFQKALFVRHSSASMVEGRVDTMLNLYRDIVLDSKKAVAIISTRAISSAINYVVSNGVPLNSSNETLKELIVNGSINSAPQPLMQLSTIRDWERKIESLCEEESFACDVEVEGVTILPYDSFTLQISFNLSVSIADEKGVANLSRERRLVTFVGIEGFEDPLYPLNTYGRATNTILKSPHWGNYSEDDLSNLKDDLNNSYYHPSLRGASFLDRLEGKYFVQPKYEVSGLPIGLESFVDKDELLTLGIPVYLERSSVDYLYFSGKEVEVYKISGMPESFRLDNETTINNLTHLQIYNVSSRVVVE